MEPGLIEQGEIYGMQCCEYHGKGVRKSAPKKAKYHAGVAVKNLIAGLCQVNCSYSEIDPKGRGNPHFSFRYQENRSTL